MFPVYEAFQIDCKKNVPYVVELALQLLNHVVNTPVFLAGKNRT